MNESQILQNAEKVKESQVLTAVFMFEIRKYRADRAELSFEMK